jgi:predicted HNH restriction endonuclease
MQRICDKCHITKELSLENFRKSRHGNFLHICKKCESKSAHERNKKRRKEQKIKSIELLGGKCCICGYDKCLRALVFHHPDPNKKEYNISEIKGLKFEKIKKELKKCVLVCRNCHSEIHDGFHKEYLLNYSHCDFNQNFISKDKCGVNKYESNRKNIKKSKKKCVEYKGGKCSICDYNKSLSCMSFHHINPKTKSFNFNDKRGYKFETLQPELDKCILVCGNCHDEIHSGMHKKYVI